MTARVKPGRADALDRAIADGTLGAGSIAGDEYLHNMAEARELGDGRVKWVETCFCAVPEKLPWISDCAMPLAEERPYWEAYFELLSIKDAHARSRCRHESGEEYWACANCNCTEKLEQRLAQTGRPFREGSG